MFYNVSKRCKELNVAHTFGEQNLGWRTFNTLGLRKMLCNAASLLVNEPKLAELRPFINGLLREGVTADYTFTSAGVVRKVSFIYQNARVELSYRRK